MMVNLTIPIECGEDGSCDPCRYIEYEYDALWESHVTVWCGLFSPRLSGDKYNKKSFKRCKQCLEAEANKENDREKTFDRAAS